MLEKLAELPTLTLSTHFFLSLVANRHFFENCRSWGEARLSLSRQFGHTKSCFFSRIQTLEIHITKKVTQRNGLLNGYLSLQTFTSFASAKRSPPLQLERNSEMPAKFYRWNSCIFSLPPPPKKLATTQICFRTSFPGGPLKSFCFPKKTSTIPSFCPYIRGRNFNCSVPRNCFAHLFT